MEITRQPAVAGLFYPAEPTELAAQVDALLDEAMPAAEYSRAIIAPHAGYVYSGPTAAHAYRALDPKTKRVLILGPTHRVGIEGMALTGADLHRTPLGVVPSDIEITDALEELPDVIVAPVVHAQEHSLEVHLPFLQRYLDGPFTVVPVAVGHATPESVAKAIEIGLSFPDTAVVISSDLSHFLTYEQARMIDAQTLAQIASKTPALTPGQACGAYPVSGMMKYAQTNGWEARILDASNSGDTAGDKSRVVGYPAVAWYPRENEGISVLPTLAYNAIADAFGAKPLPLPDAASEESALKEDGASFVTLNLDGRLRGCIGTLQAQRPLKEDIQYNAVAAALRDPRFPELSKQELERVDLDVSVLTEPVPLWEENQPAPDEQVVLGLLRPGVDGVIVEYRGRRATFLPQVWDQLPQPEMFMGRLKEKAGLPSDFWAPEMNVSTYQVEHHHLDRSQARSDPD